MMRCDNRENKIYIAIDLKSFYASVECIERGLDPLKANLVVADTSRTDKTICLAVSPSLKSHGIPGRPRLFEVEQAVERINAGRLAAAPGRKFSGESYMADELRDDPSLKLSYIAAVPRMAYYMEYSTAIFDIYQKYAAPEDIHVYSIDEVFIDITPYMEFYGMTPRDLTMRIIREVLEKTGITATAGIGTNMYLCKVAMDIVAKKMPADENGVRIAELNERSYREMLWDHRPLTDFWRVGRGTAARLEKYGIFTMGDIARCSLGRDSDFYNEDILYREFGINAELLIDHAWGWEPVGIREIKAYRPKVNSLCSGQVLNRPYKAEEALVILKEMADGISLELVDNGLTADQLLLDISYDGSSLDIPELADEYRSRTTMDMYGRKRPQHAHGSIGLDMQTSSSEKIISAAVELFDRIVDRRLLIRKLSVTVNRVIPEGSGELPGEENRQLSIFDIDEKSIEERKKQEARLTADKNRQMALLSIKKRFGKNAVLRGTSYEECATAKERNHQIGGHRA